MTGCKRSGEGIESRYYYFPKYMEKDIVVVEQVKSVEKIKNEPVVEILGSFAEVSRGKYGGADSSPTKRRQ